MGQAFDRDGQVLGEVVGDTKREVFEKLTAAHPDAEELRIKSVRDQIDAPATSAVPSGARRGNEGLTLDNIDDAMRYQPWDAEQLAAGDAVREALTTAAKAILRSVPPGAFRSVALRNVIDARMNANAGISFRGRF